MLQMFPSVYKSYHHEDNNFILKKAIKTILSLNSGLYTRHHLKP